MTLLVLLETRSRWLVLTSSTLHLKHWGSFSWQDPDFSSWASVTLHTAPQAISLCFKTSNQPYFDKLCLVFRLRHEFKSIIRILLLGIERSIRVWVYAYSMGDHWGQRHLTPQELEPQVVVSYLTQVLRIELKFFRWVTALNHLSISPAMCHLIFNSPKSMNINNKVNFNN